MKEEPAEPNRHLVADLWGCSPEVLSDQAEVGSAMLEAAQRGGAKVVHSHFHVFRGGGITGVVLVQESHLTIHTWPRLGYAAVDIFLCGEVRPEVALAHLAKQFGARRTEVVEHTRGQPPPPDPLERGRNARIAARRRMTVLYALTLIVAMCSILYELLLAQTLSALLGNTVLRYSLTIGCYLGALGLGAMLCGSRPREASLRLTRVELGLSVVGGLSVPLFHLLDMGQRILYLGVPEGSPWEPISAVLFLLSTLSVIVAIGLLSGFEIPLLLSLGEQTRPGSTNRILGFDYFGALLGSVLFPLYLLRSLGLLATGFAVALVNAIAAVLLVVWIPPRHRPRLAVACAVLSAVLVGAFHFSGRIEQYFLKQFYYAGDVGGNLLSILAPRSGRPPVEQHRSHYQTIDMVRDPLGEDVEWVARLVSRKFEREPDYPRDLWLYIDRSFQVFSGLDEIYHEWFVHAPIQAVGSPPRRVLLLGGGDGLAVQEVLKYGAVERVVHVDIDPEMIRIAREHPALVRMNGGALGDPRVETVQADAFQWLRRTGDRFDAIYVDMPNPHDYNVSMVYSREFYAMVRRHLEPEGFVALDTPWGWCGRPRNAWGIYYSTLRAAGFPTVVPLLSHIRSEAGRIPEKLSRMAAEMRIGMSVAGAEPLPLTEGQEREYLERLFEQSAEALLQEFTVAFPVERPMNRSWREFGVPLHAFGPEHLEAAFPADCPDDWNPARVNSVFRPTLPPLFLLSIRMR